MVVFTCNHCGDSVKKSVVEKHYSTKCRNPVFVSCMDCLKDFREDYVEHTRCITEAEKYSGKDYVPKEPRNSGLKKQESWLEIVRSILTANDYEVSPAVRGIFQKLQNYDNVPRKKAKFENFVSNSMHVRKYQAEAVWKVLEKALDKLKAAREEEMKKSGENNENGIDKSGKLETNGSQEIQENGQHAEEGEQGNSKEKKKKNKRKHLEESSETALEQISDDPAKKKTKKSKTTEDENGLQEAAEITSTTDANVENGDQLPKKSKKSKRKAKDSVNGGTESVVDTEENSSPKQPLKTKNDLIADQEEVLTKKEKKSDNSVNESSPGNLSKFKGWDFDWKEVIFKVLGKHKDGIGLEELKAEVLEKYKARYQLDTIPWKLEKSFNKKLRKSGFLVENDIVKINETKKSKTPEDENGVQEATEITSTTDANVEKGDQFPKKSKKSKRKAEDAVNGGTESVVDQEEVPIKKEKESDNSADESSADNLGKFKVGEFDWNEVIFKVLGKNNNEISLEKLKAKVLKKYKGRYQLDTIPWKLEKTFNKKLRNSGLLVENDIVKINVK